MKTQCVIYARVSTNLQDTESQIQDLQKWVKYNDYEVSKIFTESISGYDLEKPELEKLKEYIKTHDIKQVITYELSRLGRSTQQTLTEIKYFTSQNVNVHFKKDNLDTISDSGINSLIITILSGIAEMEGTTLKDRVKRGRMLSASKGKRVGFTKMPLGYSADENGFIIINQEDSNLVQSMYKAIASGISAPKLAKDLNSKGVLTYNDKIGKKTILKSGNIISTKWNGKTLKNIIKNTRYKGFRNYGGESFPVPRIVSDEIWEEANQKINDHTGYLSRTKYNYLFKSKITCGQCGYTLKSLRKYSKKKEDVLYYTCQSYLHTGINCDCGRFRSEVFDQYLYDIIFQIKGMSTAIKKENSESKRIEFIKKIEYWNKEQISLTKEKEKEKNLYVKGFSTEDEMEKKISVIIAKLNECISELKHLEKGLKNLDEPEGLPIEILKKYYLHADFATKRGFVEEYVQRIKVYKVENIDFDLSKISWNEVLWYDKKVKKITFNQPKKNEVIWYVELFAYNDPEPHPILMTSSTGTNYLNYSLKFDGVAKTISLTNMKG